MSKKNTKEEFIEKSKKIHGNKYDYSKVEYINSKTNVCIICPKHGEFWQMPQKHIIGQGCPFCCKTKKKTKDNFIKNAINIHGNKYDYSKVEYVNNNTKVCIVCHEKDENGNEHGEFWQTPHNHLKGERCPICSKKIKRPKKFTTKSFIEEAKKIHGDKYDYSKVEYIGAIKKVCIICPKHGEFWQSPYSHINGSGCQMCSKEKNGFSQRKTTEDFIKQSKEIHGDKYDYSKVEYKTAKNKVCIICPKHGEFWQSPYRHTSGSGCPKCVHHISKGENDIFEYVKSLLVDKDVIQSEKNLISPKEIDIYIPSLKIGIEYNGLYWHSNINKNNHLEKLNLLNKQGIKLIQVFEDEYENKKDIVFSKIAHLIGVQQDLQKIMGRKCDIKEIDSCDAKAFLEKYHIQGYVSSTIHIGCFYNNELVAVMSFKQEHKDSNEWDLTRFASDYNYVCQGVGSKLFKYFVKKYNPNKIKSFADRRWTINEKDNIYTKIGFEFDGYTPPDYKYFSPLDGIIRQHKFGFRKKKLNRKYGLPLSMTESEMTQKLGYDKIFDCGLIRYVWKNKNC